MATESNRLLEPRPRAVRLLSRLGVHRVLRLAHHMAVAELAIRTEPPPVVSPAYFERPVLLQVDSSSGGSLGPSLAHGTHTTADPGTESSSRQASRNTDVNVESSNERTGHTTEHLDLEFSRIGDPSTERVNTPSLGTILDGNTIQDPVQRTAVVAGYDIDVIEIAPPQADPPKNLSENPEVTRIPSQDADVCEICNAAFGDISELTGERETKAYLPCGHFFGSKCLFWAILNPNNGRKRCPRDSCISLQHICNHPSLPSTQPPARCFNDVNAIQLPWLCECCNTKKGKSIHNKIVNCEQKLLEMEGDQEGSSRLLKFKFPWRAKQCDKLLDKIRSSADKRYKSWFSWKMEVFESVNQRREKIEAKVKKEGEKQESKDRQREERNAAKEQKRRRREQESRQAVLREDLNLIMSRFNMRQMNRLNQIPEEEEGGGGAENAEE